MQLRRFLNFVWRSIGPQGALLYTALLIIRRVESSKAERKLYHESFDFMASFAAANGPNVLADRLNGSCKPFYPLPKSLPQLADFLHPDVLSRQFDNSTRTARLILRFWSRFALKTTARLPDVRLKELCSFLLEEDRRLTVCQAVAHSQPPSSSTNLTINLCVQRTVVASPSPVPDQECSHDDVVTFNDFLIRSSVTRDRSKASGKSTNSTAAAKTQPQSSAVSWRSVPVFYCARAKNHSDIRRWLVVQELPIRMNKPVRGRERRMRRRRRNVEGDTAGEQVTIGMVRLMYPLDAVRINQCETENRCSSFSAKCKYRQQPTSSLFSLGNYYCECDNNTNRQSRGAVFNGSEIESYIRNSSYSTDKKGLDGDSNEIPSMNEVRFTCHLCSRACISCNDKGECRVAINYRSMRDFPLGVQSFCITVCLVIMGIVFKIRRKRVIKTSGWALIEIFIFGAVLLYATVVVMYFEPTKYSCLLLPWLREVGFSITYGTLIVKVYRVLSGFQSRKAHRVCVRDKDVLRYILGIFVAVVAYMGAWTAVNVDHELIRMVEDGTTPDHLNFSVCRAGIWCGVAEASELLFLCWGLYYCHCVRSAPSEYSELRFITVSLIFETVVSLVVHIVHHFIWNTLHPDYVYLLYFVRCHLTVTITVILIIGPKLWYLHRPPATQFGRTPALSHAESHLVQPIKLNLTSNGDIDLGEINIADMDPEDIRRELKRLYTQMEIYKTKEMRKDNPHVSKRRGGRKQTHRRFSLQPFHHKHRSHPTSASVHEEEVSKVSDGSNNSGDEGGTSGERKTTS